MALSPAQRIGADATGSVGFDRHPQRTIAYWERTGRLGGRKEILALAKALKVSIPELLREKHKPDQRKSLLPKH
jgi:hypothetical protein